MEDNYVICTGNYHYEKELIIGNKYHVEEAFNISPENNPDKDPEIITLMLKEYPNPFLYLEEFKQSCSCCGDRVYFWHGLFVSKKQIEEKAVNLSSKEN